jgi:hypothetical protein
MLNAITFLLIRWMNYGKIFCSMPLMRQTTGYPKIVMACDFAMQVLRR